MEKSVFGCQGKGRTIVPVLNKQIHCLKMFCQVFHPDPQSTSQLFSRLLPRIATAGSGIEVVCGFPADTPAAAEEDWEGLHVQRVGSKDRSRRGISARLLAYLDYLYGALRILKTTKAGTTVVACTPPCFPF